jgi:cystathionine beta-lyase
MAFRAARRKGGIVSGVLCSDNPGPDEVEMTVQSVTQAEPFLLSVEQLRARRSTKWNKYGSDVLPAWVADMDFAVPDAVQEAIARLVEHRDYGYGAREGDVSLAAAFVEYMRARFGWSPDPELVLPVSELIQGMFTAVMAFSEPGDGVVLQTPIYPPFLMTVEQTGRRMVENRLIPGAERFEMDVAGLPGLIDDRTRVVMVCNPHNPTGRVFEREELLAVGRVAVERDLLIVADEIHADLVYPPRQHVPMAMLGPEIAARTITLTSATKSFNIPGLRCALMYFGSMDLRERFRARFPDRSMGQVGVVGVDATVAAWRHGGEWLEGVLGRLGANRERLTAFLASELPEVGYRKPEGTYLAWLDCNALGLPEPPFQFFLERARVGLSDGAEFGTAGRGCVRLNFATAPEILDQVLERMAGAVGAARR